MGSLLKILKFLDFSGAQTGGSPKKFQIFFSPKVVYPCYKKSQLIKKHVSYAKISVISDIGLGGWIPPPPIGNRVD